MLMGGSASFSIGRQYRFRLTRSWGSRAATVAWIMLNPSTADAIENDATVRRCINYTRRWGYEQMDVVNLFAYRSAHPGVLMSVVDPIGKDNDAMIDAVARMAALVI